MTNSTGVKKKPRGKPFTGKADPRRNTAGQRNKAAVETAVQARALYVQVLNEPDTKPAESASNLEVIVRRHVHNARNGDANERELIFDRIWGKANQPIDLTSSDGSMTPQAVTFIPFRGNEKNVSADNTTT